MQFERRHSTRDRLGIILFFPVIMSLLFGSFIWLWAQGEIPVSSDEPLSVLGVGVMFVLGIFFVYATRRKIIAPWYIRITCMKGVYTFTALQPMDNISINKSDVVSASVQHIITAYGSAVAVKLIYRDAHGQHVLYIPGDGSWHNTKGVVLRQERFCKALVEALTY